MSRPSCRGVSCPVRDGCAHYRTADRRNERSRLCEEGRRDEFEPARASVAQDKWAGKMTGPRATPFDGLIPKGT